MITASAHIALYGIAAACGAATVALLLIFLQQRSYLKIAVAVTLGMIVMQFGQALMLLYLPRLQESLTDWNSGIPAHPLILTVLGAIMLLASLSQLRTRASGNALNERLSSLMPRIGVVSAFAIGLVLILTNIKIWALAVATLSEADKAFGNSAGQTTVYFVYVLIAQSVLLVLILAQLLLPRRSKQPLDAVGAWLAANGNAVVAAVTGVIGLYFFLRGAYYMVQALL